MDIDRLSIGELADAAGLSRRTVRFYVQQRLLSAPGGRGRKKHYDASHVARLKQIADLQAAGHSLGSIRRILAGESIPTSASPQKRPTDTMLSAELWTRLKLMEGIELHFNSARYQPKAKKLLAVREAVRQAFAIDSQGDDQDLSEPSADFVASTPADELKMILSLQTANGGFESSKTATFDPIVQAFEKEGIDPDKWRIGMEDAWRVTGFVTPPMEQIVRTVAAMVLLTIRFGSLKELWQRSHAKAVRYVAAVLSLSNTEVETLVVSAKAAIGRGGN